jgi:hypothetical protein
MNLLSQFISLDTALASIKEQAKTMGTSGNKLRRGEKTVEQIADRRRTFLAQKVAKYQAAFLFHKNRATSMKLALHMDVCRDSVNHDLKKLIATKMVTREGSIPSIGNGAKRAYLYSWNFTDFPIKKEGE